MAALMYNPPLRIVKNVFHSATFAYGWWILLIHMIFYFLLSFYTSGCSLPGGIVVPCLIVGGDLGRIFGIILSGAYPQVFPSIELFALLGGAAFLAGTTRMTISFIVILVETTTEITYTIPISITMFIAVLIGNYFSRGAYTMQMDRKKIPFLELEPNPYMGLHSAEAIMSTPVITLKKKKKLGIYSRY